MTKAEEIGQRHGIIEGFTIHSNPKIAKERFNIAMFEFGRYCAEKAFSSANGETEDDHVIVKNFIHKNFDIFWANFVETESK